eukprot:1176467-Prorocentrum_minimum.AAC.2
MCTFIHAFIHASIHSFINSSIHSSFIRSFVHSFIRGTDLTSVYRPRRRIHAKWQEAEDNHDQLHRLQQLEIDKLTSRLAGAGLSLTDGGGTRWGGHYAYLDGELGPQAPAARPGDIYLAAARPPAVRAGYITSSREYKAPGF